MPHRPHRRIEATPHLIEAEVTKVLSDGFYNSSEERQTALSNRLQRRFLAKSLQRSWALAFPDELLPTRIVPAKRARLTAQGLSDIFADRLALFGGREESCEERVVRVNRLIKGAEDEDVPLMELARRDAENVGSPLLPRRRQSSPLPPEHLLDPLQGPLTTATWLKERLLSRLSELKTGEPELSLEDLKGQLLAHFAPLFGEDNPQPLNEIITQTLAGVGTEIGEAEVEAEIGEAEVMEEGEKGAAEEERPGPSRQRPPSPVLPPYPFILDPHSLFPSTMPMKQMDITKNAPKKGIFRALFKNKKK